MGGRAIAKRTSKVKGVPAPIELKAQALREREAFTPAAGPLGFAINPDHAAHPGEGGPMSGKGRWRQADVRRAINAAEKAGLRCYRVEIAPDGTIAIVVGILAESAAGSG